MALVRILIDGNGLLKSWSGLSPEKPSTRQQLISELTHYYDANGVPLTILFDGQSAEEEVLPSTPEVEVLFTRRGQRPDQAMAKTADRFRGFGEVLSVSDAIGDPANGTNSTSNCSDFIQTVQRALEDLAREISRYNQDAGQQFKRAC